MKSFNNTMAEENYNTSQSNLNASSEQQAQPQAQLRRQRSQQSNEQLSAGTPRTTRIADEMSQDLQYLSREAPLDGGESTFGAYSTLGGSQHQQPADNEQSTTVTHQSTYKSTVTRTSSAQMGDDGDDDAVLLGEDEGGRHPSGGRLENDYERTDFRIDGDDDATQVYDYNQKVRTSSFGSNGNRDHVQSSFGDQQQLEQLAPDNVDIQRPLQQAGSSQAIDTTEQPSPSQDAFDNADQREQQRQEQERERLAEVSRVEIEQSDLDNALGRVDEPIQMVDLAESERTMQNSVVEMETANGTVSTGHQQQQNPQVVNSSSLPLKPFLVSFMVDARGGAMRGCRHSGVRVIIPPNTAPQPMRITCRYLRRERLVHPPPLMEGEACASKIMEVGPAGARFLGPVLIEVPHFASLRGKEREIIILRSDSGEVWREHLFDTDENLVDSIVRNAELVEQQQQQHYDQENQRPSSAIGQASQMDGIGGGGDTNSQQEKRLTRIVTNEFPQYFAIISRLRQEVHTVGPDGLAVDSQVVPRVQAIFTDGALTKRIKIGLQKKNGTGSQPGSPEPHQLPGDREESGENVAGQERTRSPTGSRPGSAQTKRKSRFLACFGASHGSHDPLDQSGTDAEGFASGSNESSSSSAGGDSPRQLANEKLIERRHIIEDLTDSEAEDSLDGGVGANKSKMTKKLSAIGNELVPEDYYIEQEPAFILNVGPKTYGKRLASSSAQTDQKLQQNGFLTTSTRSPKRRGVNLLNVARRRRNKTQMQIPLHEPRAQLKTSQQQQSRLRPKSADLCTSTADSSLESQHADDHLDERMMIDGSILAAEDDDDETNQKWRTCTIQTDSDSVTVQYVTLSSLKDAGAAAAAAATTANKSTTTTGQDDGYVSGSGELKRAVAADQTGTKTSHKSALFLPFCSSSSAAEDDDPTDGKTSEVSEEADIKRDQKRKKAAAKQKKATKKKDSPEVVSGKASPSKLDIVLETKAEQQQQPSEDKIETEQKQEDNALVGSISQDPSGPQQSGGEEADESLVTTTTTRSISPSSKERKQQLKLEKQEKLKKEKLDRLKQKELDEANAKALKAQKKLEKEAKKKAEKEEKLAKKLAASSSKQQSPSQSRAQSPEQVAESKQQQQAGDELKTSEKSSGVLGAITKTIQSVKFAPSPTKDSPTDKSADKQSNEQSDDLVAADRSVDDRVGVENEDGSLVHVSIGTDSHLLSESQPKSGELDRDDNETQLISFSSETETLSSAAAGKLSASGEQAKVLKPILKQQSSSIEEPQAIASTELKISEPKALSSIADQLISEATEEAVRAADALQQQQAQLSSGTSSPTLTSSVSDSKKETAKRLKAEKEKFKAELKSSLDEEKRLSKEAKRLAKQAEEAARKAEREAKKVAVEAKEEAERQAEIAKREAEAALKLIEAQVEEPAEEATSSADETKIDKSELKKRAKLAEAEAKRLAKEADDEAKRLAKEVKKQAKEAAAQEKARLKAEKKQKAKLGVEPSAPSIDLISSSSPETSKSSPQKGVESEVVAVSEEDSKSVPIGLPRVSFELERGEHQEKLVDPTEPESAAPVDDQTQQAALREDATESQPAAEGEVVPNISDKSATELAAESTTSDKKSDEKVGKSKQKKIKKKDKKKKKRAVSDKGDAASISSRSSSEDVSLPTETVSKSSSFLGRLFRIKHKQQQEQPKGGSDESAPLDSTTVKSDESSAKQLEQQDQMMIVSEMYPSDPNNADGEMILEVNLPEDLISESRQADQSSSTLQEQSPEEKIESGVTSIVTSTTGQQAAEPTDDQEATLVNLSQMKDDVNDDEEDDDEATENVLSQANDLVEDHHQHQEVPNVVQDLAEPSTELEVVESEKIVVPEPAAEFEVDKSDAEQQQQQVPVVSQEGAVDAIEASTAPQVVSTSQAESKDLVKDEKARKELEAKLEKEAKKRATEEEKARKKQEKEDKKRAELEAKKQAKEEKERKKREAKEAKKVAELEKKQAKKNKLSGPPKTDDTNTEPPRDPTSGSSGGGAVENATEQDQQQATSITTTTITSTSTTTGDERTLNPNIGEQAGDGSGHVIMSTISEVPINEETEVERIVEEVVGDDGTVTKTTRTVETKYVTMRQEEIRVAERRDMSVEEWERLQAERAEQQPSTSDGQFIERIKRQATFEEADHRSPELDEICATPSYFDPTQPPAEIKPDTSEKKALKMRFKLNQKLIKRAQKLARVESKKAKRDQRRAEAEIAVCDEAARQARKELKSAVKEAKRAAKLTEKQHKKMDKIDKKLTKRAKELEKRQKKIDKQLAKAAKKQAKKDAKAAKKAAKLQRAGSSSSKSPSRSSKRSIRVEDIGEPVLRSSSRLSIVQNNPNVELSIQQPVEQIENHVNLQTESDQQQPVVESADIVVAEASFDPAQATLEIEEANQVDTSESELRQATPTSAATDTEHQATLEG